MRVYLESSAIVKLLLAEEETPTLRTFLDAEDDPRREHLSCTLVETELRRSAQRGGIPQDVATSVLDSISVFDVPRTWFGDAGRLPGDTLRSLDALHVVAALHLEADLFVSYDDRPLDAARDAGLNTASPGRSSP